MYETLSRLSLRKLPDLTYLFDTSSNSLENLPNALIGVTVDRP